MRCRYQLAASPVGCLPLMVSLSNHEDRLATSLMNSGGYPRSNRHFINEIASQSENAIELATVIEGDFIKMP
jgi:hypothetical protein